MIGKGIRYLLTLVLFVTAFAAVPALSSHQQVLAATITVSGGCTDDDLDAAITGASSGDTIVFDCDSTPHTILFDSTGSIAIDKELTIDGGGVITLDGNESTKFFSVTATGNLTVRNLSFHHGWADINDISAGQGGAIVVAVGSVLSVESSTFDGNGADVLGGAIRSFGTTTVSNSTFMNNNANSGGAIFSQLGMLTVTNSAFSNNTASFGGAIFEQEGTTQITGSTFTENQATTHGGAIYNLWGDVTITDSALNRNGASDEGGAIFNDLATLTVNSSTFWENIADHVGAIKAGEMANTVDPLVNTVTVTNSTFVGNSSLNVAAIELDDTDGTMSITSSTFFGSAPFGPGEDAVLKNTSGTLTVTASIFEADVHPANCSGTIGSGGYNLSSDDSCGFTTTGDIENGDANLAPLADNGGPTQTMLLQEPSDAIDAIPSSFCDANLPASDQRGIVRPQLNGCDIGAVELALNEFDQTALCANRYNGDLRMPRRASCASTETLIELPADGPLNVCVNRYNGDARYSRTGRCASTESLITVVGNGSQSVCVNRYNGEVRVPRSAGQCASTEVARLI